LYEAFWRTSAAAAQVSCFIWLIFMAIAAPYCRRCDRREDDDLSQLPSLL
jgi:hypothetical protein